LNERTVMMQLDKLKLPKGIKYRKSYYRGKSDFPYKMSINLPFDESGKFMFNVYDSSAAKINLGEITKKSIVSAILEVTDIWVNTNSKEFGTNWTAMQIRKFKSYSPIQEFFLITCFLCDEDDPEDPVYDKMIETYKRKLQTPLIFPQFDQNMRVNNFNPMNQGMPPPPPPPPVANNGPIMPKFIPSPDQLISAKEGLKKTVVKDKKEVDECAIAEKIKSKFKNSSGDNSDSEDDKWENKKSVVAIPAKVEESDDEDYSVKKKKKTISKPKPKEPESDSDSDEDYSVRLKRKQMKAAKKKSSESD